jgi:hypothetical protein
MADLTAGVELIADPRNFLLTIVFIPALGVSRRPVRWVLMGRG